MSEYRVVFCTSKWKCLKVTHDKWAGGVSPPPTHTHTSEEKIQQTWEIVTSNRQIIIDGVTYLFAESDHHPVFHPDSHYWQCRRYYDKSKKNGTTEPKRWSFDNNSPNYKQEVAWQTSKYIILKMRIIFGMYSYISPNLGFFSLPPLGYNSNWWYIPILIILFVKCWFQ